MTNKQNQLPLILLAVVLLMLVAGMKSPSFILYGGQEIEAELTTEKGDCWTLADERCVRQNVNLLNLTATGFLICPELYHSTEIDCKRAFNLITEVRKAKLDCYYTQDDVCILEQFEDQCPAAYFTTKSACETSLIDFGYSTRQLLSNRNTWIFVAIGGVALLFIILNVLRKR